MKSGLAAAIAAVSLLSAGNAAAAIVLSEGTFGSAFGVHSSTGFDQDGTTVYGTVGIGGPLVTFTSTDELHLNGAGEAIIDADPLHDLSVLFANTYGKATFNIETEESGGGYTLVVNKNLASEVTFIVPSVGFGALGNGANKYIVTASGGDVIKSFDFLFEPAVDDVKQFRLLAVDGGGGGAVPEPAAWAMMILGFGGVGAMMRRKRHALA